MKLSVFPSSMEFFEFPKSNSNSKFCVCYSLVFHYNFIHLWETVSINTCWIGKLAYMSLWGRAGVLPCRDCFYFCCHCHSSSLCQAFILRLLDLHAGVCLYQIVVFIITTTYKSYYSGCFQF